MEPTSAPISVLFVDDDAMVLSSIKRCMTRQGFNVTAVDSAEAAMTAAGTAQFDVVITDHNMPTMTGAELIDRLLASDPSLRSRIILTSGDLCNDRTEALLARTGTRGLQKPFQMAELALLIKAAARKTDLISAA